MLFLLVALAASGCHLFGSSTVTPVPSVSAVTQEPPTLPPTATVLPVVPTPTRTVSPSPSPKKSPSPSPSPTKKPAVTPTATASPTAVTPTVQISAPSGSTQNAKVGQLLTLDLFQSSDGGYVWAFTTTPDPAVLKIVKDETLPVTHKVPAGGVGGSQERRWTFQAVAPGTTSFTLNETRPSDPAGVPPLSRYSLKVVVTP